MTSIIMKYTTINEQVQMGLLVDSPPERNTEISLKSRLNSIISSAAKSQNFRDALPASHGPSMDMIDSHHFLAVAYIGHQIIGFITGQIVVTQLLGAPPHVHSQRERIYVFVEFSGKGYAKAMLSLVLHAEKAAGAAFTAVQINANAQKAWEAGVKEYGGKLEKHNGTSHPDAGKYYGTHVVHH